MCSANRARDAADRGAAPAAAGGMRQQGSGYNLIFAGTKGYMWARTLPRTRNFHFCVAYPPGNRSASRACCFWAPEPHRIWSSAAKRTAHAARRHSVPPPKCKHLAKRPRAGNPPVRARVSSSER
jgi:hypothetical protein